MYSENTLMLCIITDCGDACKVGTGTGRLPTQFKCVCCTIQGAIMAIQFKAAIMASFSFVVFLFEDWKKEKIFNIIRLV